jgi:SAM-dependent methyltransferase
MEQRQTSEQKNKSFFSDHHHDYKSKMEKLETYRNINASVSSAVEGAGLLVDIGNGGVFDYDTSKVSRIIAVDLMFASEFEASMPPNAEFKVGSALELPLPADSADTVLMNMLLHHLTGRDVETTRSNLVKAITEAQRVLRPGGKIVIMESCVPAWFFAFEKVVFKASSAVIQRISDHPPTLQFPPEFIESVLKERFEGTTKQSVPTGAWVLQYGKLWPSVLTPVQPYLFRGRKA